MLTGLSRLAIAADRAVTIEEAKAHLRVDQSIEDATIQLYLDAAIEDVARETSRALEVAPYQFVRSGWHRCRPGVTGYSIYPAIVLPIAPVRSVESVKYMDENHAEQTLAADQWYEHHNSTQGMILFVENASLPTLSGRADNVTVNFTAGHDPARPDLSGTEPAYMLPSPLRAAILLQVGHLYANRESVVAGKSANVVPMSVQRLIDQWRIYR